MNFSIPQRIGIIGGGQLGAMLAENASQLGIGCHIFCPDPQSPARHFCEKFICADYTDFKALQEFASHVDCLTYEFENIACENLEKLAPHIKIYPNIDSLKISQNRYAEKKFIHSLNLGTAPFCLIKKGQKLHEILEKVTLPAIAKTCRFGYDGKGQYTLNTQVELENFLLSMPQETMILEQKIPFTHEVSVIAARDFWGNFVPYPVTQNIHIDGILSSSTIPSNIPYKTQEKLTETVKQIADKLDYIGIITVEFFIIHTQSHDEEDLIYINEFAPRVHNSGHWTQDCADINQFLQHIRCISHLQAVTPHCQPGGMINLIGYDIHKVADYIHKPKHYVHIYGKHNVRHGRKMGHVNWRK